MARLSSRTQSVAKDTMATWVVSLSCLKITQDLFLLRVVVIIAIKTKLYKPREIQENYADSTQINICDERDISSNSFRDSPR